MNKGIMLKVVFFFIFSIYFITYGQKRVLNVSTHTSPFGSDWCWAGCTYMATQYYGNNTLECEIVEWTRLNLSSPNRGTENCCNSPTPDDCYGGLYISNLDEVLASEGLNCSLTYNHISMSSIQSIINDNRPIIIQGHHSGGGWHTMIIIGYDSNNLHYNDPAGGSYITNWNDAISYECMGRYYWQWQNYTHEITSNPCPIDLNLTEEIDADANITAQNNINISCVIGSNNDVNLIAGNSITINSGFLIPAGSTLNADVEANPCP